MIPCNCGEESTEDVAKKSKSDPRDDVPPGAEVEEVYVEPVFHRLLLVVFSIVYLNLYFITCWCIFMDYLSVFFSKVFKTMCRWLEG